MCGTWIAGLLWHRDDDSRKGISGQGGTYSRWPPSLDLASVALAWLAEHDALTRPVGVDLVLLPLGL